MKPIFISNLCSIQYMYVYTTYNFKLDKWPSMECIKRDELTIGFTLKTK